MKHETLTCPFCGAPHRETIPSGAVQVPCKYCGGTILVPPFFGGEVTRCPNHPDILAVGLCNDCGESFCGKCLYLYNVEHATLYLCPSCFRDRHAKRAVSALAIGVFAAVLGFLFFAGTPAGVTGAVLFIGVMSMPLIAWGIYELSHIPKGRTMEERSMATLKDERSGRPSIRDVSASELYNRLLDDNLRNYGPQHGVEVLESSIDSYVRAGMTRTEAVRKLAEERGY